MIDRTSPKPSRFVAYYRVSTAQQGRSGLGLEAQREAVERYLNGGAWTIEAEFTEVESGKRSDRPQLEEALRFARIHSATLVVAKVDRLTRSAGFLHALLESGVDVRFCDLPAIEGPTGRFLLNSMANVAELEAGMISQRTKAALAASKARGTKLGGHRGHAITPEAAKASRKVRTAKAERRAADLAPILLDMQQRGLSLGAMAKELTGRGIPTARGNATWAPMTVKRVLARLEAATDA